MTSTDDVHALHRQGFSIRAIADRLGLSRMKVHRTLTAVAESDGYDDEDDDGGVYDDYEPVPPFVFVGLAVAEDARRATR
jgi:DNA-binding IclR family transcriptional regulator